MKKVFYICAIIVSLAMSRGVVYAQTSGWEDKGAFKQIKAHSGPIFSASFIDSGRKIITTSGPEYKIWDTETGKLIKVFSFPSENFAFMNLTDDSTIILSYHFKGVWSDLDGRDTVKIKIIDINKDSLLYDITLPNIITDYYTTTINLYYSHSYYIRKERVLYYSLFYYRMWGTSTIYAKHFGNLYKIKSIKDSINMESLSSLPVRDYVFCDSNRIIALESDFDVAGSNHGSRWHKSFDYLIIGQQNLLSPLEIHKIDRDQYDEPYIRTFRVLQKKEVVAELLSNNKVLWWDINTLKLLGGSYFPQSPIDFHFSLSENRIIAGARKGFYIFSTPSMTAIDSIPFPDADYGWKIAVSPDSVSFAAGSSDGYLRIFNSAAIFGPDEPVSVPEAGEMEQYVVSPNPASEYINLPKGMPEGKEISIYSVIGYKVYSGAPKGEQINIEYLLPGVYFLECDNRRYKFIRR